MRRSQTGGDQIGTGEISGLDHALEAWADGFNEAAILCLHQQASSSFDQQAIDLRCHTTRFSFIDDDRRKPELQCGRDYRCFSAV